MKPHLRNLRKGQLVWAIVEENIAKSEVIINFNGDLVRVLNLSARILRAGQRVNLKVDCVHPLKLKLMPSVISSKRNSRNLDVTI
ncbi:MAG: hypothetical protein SGI74_11410 [Oligoflexia bacterium]|nr:hypothetical protein [Oligoflexia bacterium]